MDSKMVVMSTTNKMFNTALYESLTHESLVQFSSSQFPLKASCSLQLCSSFCRACMIPFVPVQVSWQRVRVANALATSGQQWVSYLDYHNSGTYNNQ